MNRFARSILFLALMLGITLSPGAGLAAVDEYQDVPPGLLLERTVEGFEKKTEEAVAEKNVHIEKTDRNAPSEDLLPMAEIESLYQTGEYAAITDALQQHALAGDAGAQFLLGMMLELGQGVDQDAARGAIYLMQAAEQGQPLAQHRLAVLYFKGEGVERDLNAALVWLNRAVETYPPGPAKDRAISDRDNLAAQMGKKTDGD